MKKKVKSTLLFLCLGLYSVVAQTPYTAGKWQVMSVKPGFIASFNGDSTRILKLKSTGLGYRTRFQRYFHVYGEAIANIQFEAKNVLQKGDTCTYYTIAYASGRPTLSYSKSFTYANSTIGSGKFARFHYLPKGTDSIIVGYIVAGHFDTKIIKSDVDFIQGSQLKAYRDRMVHFARDPKNLSQLSTLCKVWGLLKYFTPQMLNEKLDWDELLMSSLKDSFEAFDQNLDLNTHVDYLMAQVPYIRPVKIEKLDEETLSFVNKLLINKKNKLKLLEILRSGPRGQSKYFTPPASKPYVIFNEGNVDDQILPDARARVLSLFRYWNIINYFYPHKSNLLPNWDADLQGFISSFIIFDDITSYNESLLLLNAAIGDGHSALPLGSILDLYETLYFGKRFCVLPMMYRLAENHVYISQIDSVFMASSGLRSGDRLISVNKVEMDSLAAKLKDYISDTSYRMKQIYLESSNWLNMLPIDRDSIILVYQRAGNIHTTHLKWSIGSSQKAIKFLDAGVKANALTLNKEVLKYMPDNKLLYINPYQWNKVLADSVISLLGSCDRLVVDCRSYPHWDFLSFVERLIPDDVPLVKYTYATSIPGHFGSTLKRSQKD
ncbi:MAG: hypothetical protein EOP48_12285, partial [Sphingobacteriales bacterium]